MNLANLRRWSCHTNRPRFGTAGPMLYHDGQQTTLPLTRFVFFKIETRLFARISRAVRTPSRQEQWDRRTDLANSETVRLAVVHLL